jgi:hypothetical protein
LQRAWSPQKQFVTERFATSSKRRLTVILANRRSSFRTGAHRREEAQWIENTRSEGIRMKSIAKTLLFLANSRFRARAGAASRVNLSDLVQGTASSFASVAYEATCGWRIHPRPSVVTHSGSERSCAGSAAS